MIKFNGKDVTPKINGVNLSRVMYNGKKIWPLDPAYYIPEEAPNGVYVYANDGLLYVPDSWDTGRNDDAVGVAVVTENTRLCVKKGINAQNNIPWSNALYGTDVPEIANSDNDYKGLNNSIVIRQATSSENDTNNAAWYCYSQTINVNGNTINGYLPAFGELEDIRDNSSIVDSILSLIGSSTITSIYSSDFLLCSSTESSSNNIKCPVWGNNNTNNLGKEISYPNNFILPCFPILPTLVDLGLPSGTLWSATNLGAFKPEQSGYYYQWGDTSGYTATQVGTDKQFTWSDYKYNSGSSFNPTKYTDSDQKVQLDLEDDAVYAALGGNWRMPTVDDWRELTAYTTTQVTSINGIQGMKFTSKNNSNYIFFPFAGYADSGSMSDVGSRFRCWSSTLLSVGDSSAWTLYCTSGGTVNLNNNYGRRMRGQSVRGVYKP